MRDVSQHVSVYAKFTFQTFMLLGCLRCFPLVEPFLSVSRFFWFIAERQREQRSNVRKPTCKFIWGGVVSVFQLTASRSTGFIAMFLKYHQRTAKVSNMYKEGKRTGGWVVTDDKGWLKSSSRARMTNLLTG